MPYFHSCAKVVSAFLVVIAKIATCFPQHFIPHSFLLLKVSVYLLLGGAATRGHVLYFWRFPLFFSASELASRKHVHSPVPVPLEIVVTPSLIDTSQWYFKSILQSPSSFRAPLKAGCVPDETHKTAHSASLSQLPFIIWLLRAECTTRAPTGCHASDQLL